MKNFKIFLISLLTILILSSCVLGKSAVIPPDECFETDGETITKYDFENEKCPTDIIIPEKIRGIEITIIGKEAFYHHLKDKVQNKSYLINEFLDAKCKENFKEECEIIIEKLKKEISHIKTISSIQFSDNIIKILPEAFAFNSIEKIIFGKNLSDIKIGAFAGNNIKYIDFSNVENPLSIFESAFSGNKFIRVSLPNGSEYIENSFSSWVKVDGEYIKKHSLNKEGFEKYGNLNNIDWNRIDL